ncbi:MAG: VOC family protein [Akkermansia sp.]
MNQPPLPTAAYPRAFSHIGLSVPNIEQAVAFYKEVMGWYLVMDVTTVVEDPSTAIGTMCIDVFGAGHGDFKIAHMVSSNSIGIELFEFQQEEGEKSRPEFQYKPTGMFHFSVQDPDIEGLVAKIIAHGGKQRMPIREYYPKDKPYRMCYVEDPFGIVFEIYTHSYEVTYSQGAY